MYMYQVTAATRSEFNIGVIFPYCLRIAVALTIASARRSRHLYYRFSRFTGFFTGTKKSPFIFLNDIRVVVTFVYLVNISRHCEYKKNVSWRHLRWYEIFGTSSALRVSRNVFFIYYIIVILTHYIITN